MNERAPIFSADVAEFALELAEYQRLRVDEDIDLEKENIVVSHVAAGGIVVARWSVRISRCLDSVATLREMLRYHPKSNDSTDVQVWLSTIREGLLNIEDVLSKTLDEQQASVWNSLPQTKRVQRIAAMIYKIDEMHYASHHAETRAARAAAAEMCIALRRVLEERVEMDADAASMAGYDDLIKENLASLEHKFTHTKHR